MRRANGKRRLSPGAHTTTPRALALADLVRSGLDEADARVMGLKFLSGGQTAALGPTFKDRPSIQIPYYSRAGRPTGFFRVRYLGPDEGLDALARRPQRYAQAAGTSPEVYFPRRPGLNWEKAAAAEAVPLWITEGEKKSACACKAGILTLGLGGVWSWKSAKEHVAFLPVLAEFAWRGREVRVAFDSDVATNAQVLRALLALARELTRRGARVKVVEIKEGPEGRKRGLDDLIVAEGRRALDELEEDAKPFSESEELWLMNEEVVYIKDPGLVVVLSDGRKMSASAFKEHAYANRFYVETKVDKEGEARQVDKPIAPAWLSWPHRAELARITYEPGAPRVTARREYNYWKGWGCEPRAGDASPWTELLDYLFGKNVGTRTWFERWCAWPLQHPGDKLYTAAVVWGVATGTGKSLVGYSLAKIYGDNFAEITDQDLQGQFNEWAENKQFVMGDDVAGSEHKKGTADRLKFMVTRQQIRLNPKYVPSFVLPDRINYYFNSNHPDAFFVEDDDRRYFVHEAPPVPREPEFYKRYDAWLRSKAGPPALFGHLLRLDLGDFDPKGRAFETRAKRAMISDAKSDVAAWVSRLAEDPDSVLRLGEVKLERDLFTNAQLLALYDPESKGRVTANGLGRELKRAGIRQALDGLVVAAASGAGRYYAVRNAGHWLKADHAEVAAHLLGAATAAKKKGKYA
jgi:hypothetical protein